MALLDGGRSGCYPDWACQAVVVAAAVYPHGSLSKSWNYMEQIRSCVGAQAGGVSVLGMGRIRSAGRADNTSPEQNMIGSADTAVGG